MKRCLRLSVIGVAILAACSEPTSAPQQPPQAVTATFSAAHPMFESLAWSPGAHVHVLPTRAAFAATFSGSGFAKGGSHGGGGGHGGGGKTTSTGIFYHGGPIIYSPQIAAIYWASSTIYSGGPTPGSAGNGSQDDSNVGLFMRSLGGTGYWNINSTYYDGTGNTVNNSLTYTRFWADNTNAPSSGASVSDAAVQAEVANAFQSKALTYDPSTLYAVFSGPGVNLGGGAGTSYCAYHGYFTWHGNNVKYAVFPYDYAYGGACAIAGASPTNDAAAAAEVNVVAHEAEETATDEDLNAWYDHRGYENADKCAWNFGTASSGSTGTYNQTMGGEDWLIQMNWVDAGSGGCLQSY